MNDFQAFVEASNSFLWGIPIISVLLGVGLYLSFRMRFVQFRLFKRSVLVMLFGEDVVASKGRYISTFQAFATGLATRAGIGNMVGVSVAISVAGPGAVFWMWISALIGMASAFAESSLAQLFKERQTENIFRGGPAYYIQKGLGQRWLGSIFAMSMIFVGFVFGNLVQVNTITASFISTYGFSAEYVAVFLSIGVGLVLFGGTRRVAQVSAILAPILVFGYLILAAIIIGMNFLQLPHVFAQIFQGAFGLNAVYGASVGVLIKEAMVLGIKRGLFSNEAGMGSAPNAAAISNTSHPVSQGLVQMLGVFIDTIVICTATAMIILLSGVPITTGMTGIALIDQALGAQLGSISSHLVTWSIFLFAFSSVLGYYVYTESNVEFLLKGTHAPSIFICRLAFIAITYIGCIVGEGVAWGLADLSSGLSAFINLIALLALSPYVIQLLKDYELQLTFRKKPKFSRESMPKIAHKLSKDVW